MNYAQIRHYDIANGLGVRTTLFVSGCRFNCKECFNKEYQNFSYGNKYDEDTKIIIKSFISEPNVDGLSILGGDPLHQDDDGIMQLIELCDFTHSIGKDVWLWSGFIWEDVFKEKSMKQELIKNVDVFVDGLFNKDLKDLRLKFKGSSNQRVINVKRTLEENKIITL